MLCENVYSVVIGFTGGRPLFALQYNDRCCDVTTFSGIWEFKHRIKSESKQSH